MKRCFQLVVIALVIACDPTSGERSGAGDDDGATLSTPDARISMHVIRSGAPTREGLAYIGAVARIHGEADAAADDGVRAAALRRGLAMPVPAGLAEAEVLRLELATRLGETLGKSEGGVAVALDLLEPMLAPEESLPRDRATARALVTLGDLAVTAGDDALAAGSYARAIRVMSSLRKELEQ